MGRILFIRVSAETYDEKDVLRAWPRLYASVWPDSGVDGSDAPKKILRALTPDPKRGALQLADAVMEHVRFGALPEAGRKVLQESADTLERLRAVLDEALGDRDVQKASGLLNAIEDALDAAEMAARDFYGT